MGEFKPMLEIGGVSVVETAATRMRRAGISEIIVVAGHERELIIREAHRLGCRPVYNPDYKSGMFSSVSSGIIALPPDIEAFFILPVDIPLVKPSTYVSLEEAFRAAAARPDVVYPLFRGERAHPPLVSRSMIEPILSWRGERGLQGFFLEHPHTSIEVPVGDRASVLDMDTPDDYRHLLDYAKNEFYPDDDECAELLMIAGAPPRVARHSRVVADCAMLIADALSAAGVKINFRLLRAAALLHDIAKGQKDHEIRGARWLRGRGYSKVAGITASHKDLPVRGKTGEVEVLYLADKITDGTDTLTLEDRLARMEERFPRGSEAMDNARRRLSDAMLVQKKIEDITGMSLEEILGGVD